MLEEPSKCDCPDQEIRRRKIANGTVLMGKQCLDCGRWVSVTKNSAIMHTLSWYDKELRDSYNRKQSEFYSLRFQERQAEWRAKYEAHLRSAKWAMLRQKVLARPEHGLCEGCGLRRAVEVHHLTYKRMGNEMLFDLVAVCSFCHEAVHEAAPNEYV